MMKKFCTCLFLSLVINNSAPAQINEIKILPDDGNEKELFGFSESISGDYAIVGAPFSNDSAGAAYIFKWDGFHWNEEQKLFVSDGTQGDYFGISVSISTEYLVIGAPSEDSSKGAAYIYRREGTIWIEDVKLKANDGVQGDRFGTSVSVCGNYVIAGASLNNNAGSAYIFKQENGNWIEQQKLSNNNAGQRFGISVSMTEDYIIVGASYLIGSAYIYKREGNNWVEVQKLTSSLEDSLYNRFGLSVSISGDYAVVGSCGSILNGFYTGAAYIYKRDGIHWNEEQKIYASDGTQGDYFGVSVSISTGYLVIGAPYDDDNGANSGSAYIFGKVGASWIEQQKLTASDAFSGDIFGVSVSISGNKAIVGAPGNDDNGDFSGSAYIYSGFITDVEIDKSEIPCFYSLNQNYPNPFNPSTKIRYAITHSSIVVIKVYDILGNELETLVSEEKPAGAYEITWYAKNHSSGIYFYRLQAGDFIETKKMILIK